MDQVSLSQGYPFSVRCSRGVSIRDLRSATLQFFRMPIVFFPYGEDADHFNVILLTWCEAACMTIAVMTVSANVLTAIEYVETNGYGRVITKIGE